MRILISALVLALAAAPAVSQPAAPAPAAKPPPTVLSTKDVMRHVVNPAAERFWKTSGSVSDESGAHDRAPTADSSWTEMVDAGAILHEAGETLGQPGRGPDDAPWKRYARMLSDAGVQAMAAARAKDADKAFEAGSAIYDACYACHGRYIPRPKNSLWKQP